MNAELKKAEAPAAPKSARPKAFDLQQIFTWLLADGIVEKANVKSQFAHAQSILRNAVGSMHPLSAVAQCKLVSALPPNRMLTLDMLAEWAAGKFALPTDTALVFRGITVDKGNFILDGYAEHQYAPARFSVVSLV